MPNVKPIATHTAHWGWDEHQYFGYPVFEQLLGSESITGLTALSVLGRRVTPQERELLDDIAVALTLADPRIWPLKLARTVASYGSSIAGLGGALLAQDNARIGPWAVQNSAQLLATWGLAIADSPSTLEQVVEEYLQSHRFVWGFGTPFRPQDERLVAFTKRINASGRDRLPNWQLFQAASELVIKRRGVPANMGMGVAAALLDIGVTPEQTGPLTTSLMAHMFVAHTVEGATEPSAELRCLPDSSIQYVGRGARLSPAKERTDR